jgi:hypothetical protein
MFLASSRRHLNMACTSFLTVFSSLVSVFLPDYWVRMPVLDAVYLSQIARLPTTLCSHPNKLLDRTYHFPVFCKLQKFSFRYSKKLRVKWMRRGRRSRGSVSKTSVNLLCVRQGRKLGRQSSPARQTEFTSAHSARDLCTGQELIQERHTLETSPIFGSRWFRVPAREHATFIPAARAPPHRSDRRRRPRNHRLRRGTHVRT